MNAGVLTRDEVALLRTVSASQGLMLESVSERLFESGGAHEGCESKRPAARLRTIDLAGELRVPFTSGVLIGIGETRDERLDALFAIRDADRRGGGHVQEVLVQNFRAKIGTRMASAPEPEFEELLWTAACARLIFGPSGVIQVPPNLTPEPDDVGGGGGWREGAQLAEASPRWRLRLGRDLPGGDARPRLPGGAVAGARRARGRVARGGVFVGPATRRAAEIRRRIDVRVHVGVNAFGGVWIFRQRRVRRVDGSRGGAARPRVIRLGRLRPRARVVPGERRSRGGGSRSRS